MIVQTNLHRESIQKRNTKYNCRGPRAFKSQRGYQPNQKLLHQISSIHKFIFKKQQILEFHELTGNVHF